MNFKHYSLKYLLSIAFATTITFAHAQSAKTKQPNIVIIYVDDLGYGDVGCYGATLVKTPNVDKLAKNGLKFTDAHCAASTCTPSRYSLLTGSYAFRNKAAILPGDAPLIIDPNTPTLPGMLKKAGYQTAVIGKWHLGLGNGNINWNGHVKPGPAEIGFNYSFLIPATGDRVPTVYLENQKVVNSNPGDPIKVSYAQKIGNRPTGYENPELLKMKADTQHSQTIVNGISRIGFMSGGEKALWKDEDFPIILTNKAKEFIKTNKEKPFFLYFSFQDIHVPRAPNKMFVGKTSMGPRGDAIAQMDWCTGEIIKELEKQGIAEHTLIIFSSDNGPVLDDGYVDYAVKKIGTHKPSGIFKGGKYSAFEAGTRVPTIAYWPSVIKPGVSDALLSQVDFYNSFATLIGQKIDGTNQAPDSFDMLPVLLGKSTKGRTVMLEEAFTLALRSDNWKYIHPASKEPPAWFAGKNIPSGLAKHPQLYNLKTDIEEDKNIASQNPDKVKELQDVLMKIEMEPTRPGFKK
ncbi:MAG: sulfatase family protein [Sphingobacteriaceae bacterium]